MKYLKLFENYSKVGIRDVAWLYFLHYIYAGILPKKNWKNDDRMGETCDRSLKKFDCVEIDDEKYTSSESCVKIIDEYFGSKDFKDALSKEKELVEYKKVDQFYDYPIDGIPYDLFLHKNPKIGKGFEKISNIITTHYNSQSCQTEIINKLANNKQIEKFNFKNYYEEFPDEPKTIKVYRGIKNEFVDRFNKSGYSCWTTKKDEAERFAKYLFTGGQQFRPIYADDPYVLETEISLSDVIVYIGGSENEIILRNPVNILNIEKISIEE